MRLLPADSAVPLRAVAGEQAKTRITLVLAWIALNYARKFVSEGLLTAVDPFESSRMDGRWGPLARGPPPLNFLP